MLSADVIRPNKNIFAHFSPISSRQGSCTAMVSLAGFHDFKHSMAISVYVCARARVCVCLFSVVVLFAHDFGIQICNIARNRGLLTAQEHSVYGVA